jgi:hypothetical protein
MAVVTTKSGVITNRDATPQVKNNSTVDGGRMRTAVGTLESVSGDSIGSIYQFFSIPSNARVDQILLYCDDIGTTTIADIGLYRTTADGGASVSAAFFGSAVSLKDGAVNASDVTHESGTFDISAAEKPLWQALGLSSDPGILYDVCATLTAASDSAGTVTLKAHYSI